MFGSERSHPGAQRKDGVVPDNFPGEGSESRHLFFFNRAKRVIDGRMFGVPLEPAEAE